MDETLDELLDSFWKKAIVHYPDEDLFPWEEWFAWYPVRLTRFDPYNQWTSSNNGPRIWLKKIRRRTCYDYHTSWKEYVKC